MNPDYDNYSPLGYSPQHSQVEDYPFYNQFSNKGNTKLFTFQENDDDEDTDTDDQPAMHDVTNHDAHPPTNMLNTTEDYQELMTQIMNLQELNEESGDKAYIPSYINNNSEQPIDNSKLMKDFSYFELREELCECVSKYFNETVTDDANFNKLFDELKTLTAAYKKATNAEFRNTAEINELKPQLQPKATEIYEHIKDKCIKSSQKKGLYTALLNDKSLIKQIFRTCIPQKKFNSFIKKSKTSTKKNAYLELIKNINNVHNAPQVANDDATTSGDTSNNNDSTFSTENELISPFYPVLLNQENLNNALLNNFQNKVNTATNNNFNKKDKLIINHYFKTNVDPIKKSIKRLYGIHETPPAGAVPATTGPGTGPELGSSDPSATLDSGSTGTGTPALVPSTTVQTGQPELSEALNLKAWKIYVKVKELSDLADLTHDTEQYFNYLAKINNLCNELPQSFRTRYFSLDKIKNVFPVRGNKANQLKLRKFRLDLNEAFIKYLNDNNIPFQNPATEDLTEVQGYYKLIDSIYKHEKKFIYVEAGRAPSVEKMQKYLRTLSEDEKNEFIEECKSYLGTEIDYTEDINNIIDMKPDAISELDQNIMVDKQLITNYDGAGCSRGYKTQCSYCKFDYVFGKYTYHVYSVNQTPLSPIYHLVKVTLTSDTSQDIQALFGFEGNVTINMLLSKAGYTKTRSGEGAKGKSYDCLEIIQLYNKLCDKTSVIIPEIKMDSLVSGDFCPNCVFYNQALSDNVEVKELLWFGNKTAGDFVIGCYKTVKDGYTGDTGVAPSNILIFCGPTDGYADDTLPNIWRSTPGKGWVFTAGVTNPDANQQTHTFFQNYICIYKLALLDKRTDITWPYEFQQDLLNGYLTRFNMLYRYVWKEFPKIINYTVKDENIYNRCFEQLFIAENYVMKQIIEKYLNDGLEIIKEYNVDNLQPFVTKIMTLPKIPNLFLSKMNVEANNNQDTTSGIEDLLSDYPPNPLKSIIITNITNEVISFEYFSVNPPPESLFSPYTSMEGIVQKPASIINPQATPNIITIPNYTIETLIYLYPFVQDYTSEFPHDLDNQVNELHDQENEAMEVVQDSKKENLRDNIKTRIVNYFNTLIENLNIDNSELKDALNTNITQILKEGSILGGEEPQLDEEVTDDIFEADSQSVINCPIDYARADAKEEGEMIEEVQEVINQQSPAVQEGEMNAEVQGVNNQQPPAVQEGEMVAEVQGVINPQSPAGYGHQQQQFGIHELPPGGPIDVVQVNQDQVNQDQANRGKRKRQPAVTQDTPRYMASTESSLAKQTKKKPKPEPKIGGKRITKKAQKKSNKKTTKKHRKSSKSKKKKTKKNKRKQKVLYTRRKR